MSDPAECLLGALTLTALKHLGDDTVVVAEDDTLCPDWRMARLGDVVSALKRWMRSRRPERH
jgi:hypothetical protein